MKISKVKIQNILGVENLEFNAGRFTKISGPNGSGKTSVLEAIKSIFKGGNDATLLRVGADKGEAVVILDDGTQISRKISETGGTTTVTDADGKKLAKPTDIIKSLTDAISVNPVDFLRATKRERVTVLLESMPIDLDSGRLEEIADKYFTQYAVSGQHALVTLETIRKAIYDERTGINRAVKEKYSTINQLSATLPDQSDAISNDSAGLTEQLTSLITDRDAELARVSEKLERLRKEHENSIAILRSQIEQATAAFAEIERKAAAQREKTNGIFNERSQGIRENLAAIQEAQKQAAKHEATRQTILTLNEDAAELQTEADKQTKALEDLESYKSELLANLPIPGLTVIDGEIYRDGVQFDRLNTAQQVEIAVEIAKIRAGDLGVIVVDGLELLDSERFDEFKRQSIQSGLQLIVTRVADDSFAITAE